MKSGKIYDIRYLRYHEDPYPHLLVLKVTEGPWEINAIVKKRHKKDLLIEGDVYGLNLHYLPKVYNKNYVVRTGFAAKIWNKFRQRPYIKKFLNNLIENVEWYDSIPEEEMIKHLKTYYPRVMENCFRHYKKYYMMVIREYDSIADAVK